MFEVYLLFSNAKIGHLGPRTNIIEGWNNCVPCTFFFVKFKFSELKLMLMYEALIPNLPSSETEAITV